jgi:hypothetical protein
MPYRPVAAPGCQQRLQRLPNPRLAKQHQSPMHARWIIRIAKRVSNHASVLINLRKTPRRNGLTLTAPSPQEFQE